MRQEGNQQPRSPGMNIAETDVISQKANEYHDNQRRVLKCERSLNIIVDDVEEFLRKKRQAVLEVSET